MHLRSLGTGSPLISVDTGEVVALHNGSIGTNVNGHRDSMGTATRLDLMPGLRCDPVYRLPRLSPCRTWGYAGRTESQCVALPTTAAHW